jgi:hypothetical protein
MREECRRSLTNRHRSGGLASGYSRCRWLFDCLFHHLFAPACSLARCSASGEADGRTRGESEGKGMGVVKQSQPLTNGHCRRSITSCCSSCRWLFRCKSPRALLPLLRLKVC